MLISRLGRGRDRRHDGRVSRARRPRRHAGRHRRRARRRDQRATAFASPGRSPSSRVRVPAFTPRPLDRRVGRRSSSRRRRTTPTPRVARAAAAPRARAAASSRRRTASTSSTIAEVVGAERTVGAFVNFGADYLEPGVIHYGGRGAVVVGEIDGRITPRVDGDSRRVARLRRRAIVTPNIWGYLWGKEAYGAMLFATALTNDSIADALAMPAYRASVHRAGARDPRGGRGRAASRPRRSTASIPRPTCPSAPARRGRALARRARRVQPTLGQDAQRHLARPRRAQAPHRSRRAARHRRDARARGRRSDAADRAPRRADPRDRERRPSAIACHAGRCSLTAAPLPASSA